MFARGTFYKNRTVSTQVAPSFSLANSLILAGEFAAVHKHYKKLLVKAVLLYVATKIDLKLKTFFCEKNQLYKPKTTKKIGSVT